MIISQWLDCMILYNFLCILSIYDFFNTLLHYQFQRYFSCSSESNSRQDIWLLSDLCEALYNTSIRTCVGWHLKWARERCDMHTFKQFRKLLRQTEMFKSISVTTYLCINFRDILLFEFLDWIFIQLKTVMIQWNWFVRIRTAYNDIENDLIIKNQDWSLNKIWFSHFML